MPAGRRKRQKRATGRPGRRCWAGQGSAAGAAAVRPGPDRLPPVLVLRGYNRGRDALFHAGGILYRLAAFDGWRARFGPCATSASGGRQRRPSSAGMIAAGEIKNPAGAGLGGFSLDCEFFPFGRACKLCLFFPKRYYFFDIVRGIIGDLYALDADGGRRQV